MFLRSRDSLMKIYDQMCFCDYIVKRRGDDGCYLYHLIKEDFLQKVSMVTRLGKEISISSLWW
jgi:hypothetical protein